MWIPSGKIFNEGQILSYLEWIKSNPGKRISEIKVLSRSSALLKLQVKFSLPMEINNCTKALRDSLWKVPEKTLIKQVIQFIEYLLSAKYDPALGGTSTPVGHGSKQQCGQWTADTIIHVSYLKKKKKKSFSSNQLSGTISWAQKSHKSWLSHEISGITHSIPGNFCKQKRLLTVFPYFISFSNPNLDGQSLLNYHQNKDSKMLAKTEFFAYIPML